jgi:uncharacterized damage-inducible protein DinB
MIKQMKRLYSYLLMFFFFMSGLSAQDNGQTDLPYSSIPEVSGPYSAGKVAARQVDGLGFRYYWATEGLREADLNFKPNQEARTTRQTLEHIYGLCALILNATLEKENTGGVDTEMPFEELRRRTLENIRLTSEILSRSSDEDLEKYKVIFKSSEGSTAFPFWNLLNGPVADAIWHTGQVASFRRSSGNPINPKVSFFTGTLRE